MANYWLAVTSNDSSSGVVDFSAVTAAKDAGIYAPLADPTLFEEATISLGVVTWPNGADLGPAWMYDDDRKKKRVLSPFDQSPFDPPLIHYLIWGVSLQGNQGLIAFFREGLRSANP